MSIYKGNFTKKDGILIGLLALVGVLCTLWIWVRSGEKGRMVQIYEDGKLIQEYSLQEDRVYEFRQSHGDGYNVIIIQDSRVCVKEANCSNQTCVHQGWISTGGQSIVCLPHRLSIEVTGESPEGLDDIVH